MRVARLSHSGPPGPISLVLLTGVLTLFLPKGAHSQSCLLPTHHAGLAFPIERIEGAWTCRVQPIIADYTTANKLGPQRTPLPESLYDYLLDRPPIAAALVNRLDLGLHKSEARGPGEFWVTDGEGTEGLIRLIHREHTARLYYLEGTHDGRFLPPVSGKAVVLLWIKPVIDAGVPAMDTTVVSYVQLNNRFLSGVLSLLRPLIGKLVVRQLNKAFDTAARLSRVMREDPARVLLEATDAPSLPEDATAFLQEALPALQNSGAPPILSTASNGTAFLP